MNSSVLAFFVTNVLAAALLGGKFAAKKDRVFKYFGIGLLFDAVAFAFWTIGYISPSVLLSCVTFGAIALLVSLVFFFIASLQEYSTGTRTLGAVIGAIVVVAIFFIGRSSPNLAFVSPEGLLFFNLAPFVQMLYIFALSFTFLPPTEFIAAKFNAPYSALVRYGFIAQFVGGVMLITSKDVQALYITGWVIGIVYVCLWLVLFFSKSAWNTK
jgi:hypothetical protein